MDELTRCLDVLGLKPGASEEEVKKAYRELAMVWHPDRFASDSPLHAKAEEKSKELNGAYEFVMAHGFVEGVPVLPEETGLAVQPGQETVEPEMPREVEEPAAAGKGKAVWMALALALAAGAAAWWFRHPAHPAKSKSPENVAARTNPDTSSTTTVIPVTMVSSPTTPAGGTTTDLLATMLAGGEGAIARNDEGTVITGETCLLTRDEFSPPFTIHIVAKTDLTNIRPRYGQGQVIFNWEMNPGELRFHDPANGQLTPVADQGQVAANEWQDIEWTMETNSTRIVVNGKERARFTGNYAALNEMAGIGTVRGGKVTVKTFEVRRPVAARASINLAAGLVLYLPFDTDENGVASDQSGFKNHGTVHGAKFTREGRLGGAMSFRGRSDGGDTIIVPHSASLVSMQRTRQLTVCAWIKPNSLPSEYPVILAKGGNFAPKAFGGYELVLRAVDDNDINLASGRFKLTTLNARGKWVSQHLNDWIHVAVVINAAAKTGKIYVNGERTVDESFLGPDWHDANFALANALFIGGPDAAHHPNRAWFDGLIDEVRVYARALTREEIRSLPGFKTGDG
jgi:hypothetical protein